LYGWYWPDSPWWDRSNPLSPFYDPAAKPFEWPTFEDANKDADMSNTTAELAARLGLEVEVAIVPANGANVPGNAQTGVHTLMTGGKPAKGTCHDTANPRPGMGARAHRNFVASGGGPAGVSFSFAVDSERAVQILPENAVNYAQGNNLGNRTSFSVEMCVNSDGDWERTQDNTARLFACVLVANGLSAGDVVQHNFWPRPNGTHKDCPKKLRSEPGAWERLLVMIDRYMVALSAPPPVESMIIGEFVVSNPFLDFWLNNGGLPIFGYPITGLTELDFGGAIGKLPVQWFERARFELQANGSVTLGRVGAEAMEAA
jgi:hypothetical protein